MTETTKILVQLVLVGAGMIGCTVALVALLIRIATRGVTDLPSMKKPSPHEQCLKNISEMERSLDEPPG